MIHRLFTTMRPVNKRNIALIAALVATVFGTSEALAVKIDVAETVPAGIVWQGQAVHRTINFSSPVDYIGSIGAVITTKKGGLTVNSGEFTDLPVRLSDSSGAPTDLYLTLVGRIGLYMTEDGRSTLYGKEWVESDFRQSRTETSPYKHLVRWQPQDPKRGYADTSLAPVLFCKPRVGTHCEIPSGTIKLTPLYIRLYTSPISLRAADPITEGGEISGNISFHRPCRFEVTNTVFNDLVMKPRRSAGLYAGGNRATTLSIRCLDGKTEQEKGDVKLTLSPTNGTVPNKPYIAKTSKEGVGIVYKVGSNPTSCQSGQKYNTTLKVRALSVAESEPGTPMTKTTTVNWGLCQYQDKVTSGPFSTTINYTLWLE